MTTQRKLLSGAGVLAIALALTPAVASAHGAGSFAGMGAGARGSTSSSTGGGMRGGTTITGSRIPTSAPMTAPHTTLTPQTPLTSPNAPTTHPMGLDTQHRTLDPPGGNDSSLSSPPSHAPLAQPNVQGASPQTQPNAPTTHPMGLNGDQSGATSQPTHPQLTQPHTTLQPLARPNAPLTHPAAPDMQHRTLDPPGGN
jgi:hypothetical protein